MKPWFLVAASLLLVPAAALAKPAGHIAVEGAALIEVPRVGYEYAAVSSQPGSTAALAVADDDALDDGILVLRLAVTNTGTGLMGLTSAQVTVTADGTKPIALMSFREMAERAHAKLSGKRFGTGLANYLAAFSAANAGVHSTYGSYSGTAYTRYGAVNTTGGITTTYRDPDEAARAQEAAAAYIQANKDRLRKKEADLNQIAAAASFAPATIFAGNTAVSPVPVGHLPAGTKALTVQVVLGQEIHTFRLTANAAEAQAWPDAQDVSPPTFTDAGVNAWISDHVDQAGWTFIGWDRGGAYFADLASYRTGDEGVVSMWFKSEMFAPIGYKGLAIRSERVLFQLDCAKHAIRRISLESHAFNNLKPPQVSEVTRNSQWFVPNPGTMEAGFADKLCAYKPAAGA